MADITAELAALPKMPDRNTRSWDRDSAWIDYYRSRLALAERALQNAVDGWTNDARAYLAHRAKEQP